MRLNLKLSHKGLIIVSVPLVFELIFLGILTGLLRQADFEVQRQIRSKAIISQANTLSKLFYDAGVAMGGYSITKSPLFSDRYDKIVRQIPQDLDELRNLVGDNPKQQEILENLKVITVTGLKILNEAKTAIDDNRVDVAQFRARHMYKQIRSLADKLQDELRGLTEDERKIESLGPEAQNRSRNQVKIFLVLGVIFNVLLALGLAILFSRGIGRRINVLTDNSIRLARGEPLLPPLPGSDEIAHLDGVFHSMADALTEASRKERAMVENATDVICSIDVDGKFVTVNPSCFNIWGYRPDELMGRRFIELVIPEDHQETIRAVRAVRAEKGSNQFENRTKHKNGSVITVLWSTFWSESERSMFCVAHDITERKLAEEAIKANERRIRTIIENMLVGLMIITPDGYVESINPASEHMFGCRSEEIVGSHVLALFKDSKLFDKNNHNDCQNFLETLFQKALNRIGEFDALKKDGEDFPINIQINELETVDGQRYLCNIVDVSERREVERLKKEFVSTVSHELRTPLTSIRGSLTLLNVGALGALPEQAKKVVTIAERNTIRLITLINDILDIEKLESGKLDMVFETIPISNPMERAQEAVKAFADNNGIKLEMLPSKVNVHADGDRIVQVLVNLISNAVKFSPKGETVTVQAEEIPNWVEIKVIDRGRGIPEKFKNALFQRFQQVEASDAKKKGGTGLGLAICKGIIEAHGGNIGVDSEEGKGSVFWFRIPPATKNAGQAADGQGGAAGSSSSQAVAAPVKQATPAIAAPQASAPPDSKGAATAEKGETIIVASQKLPEAANPAASGSIQLPQKTPLPQPFVQAAGGGTSGGAAAIAQAGPGRDGPGPGPGASASPGASLSPSPQAATGGSPANSLPQASHPPDSQAPAAAVEQSSAHNLQRLRQAQTQPGQALPPPSQPLPQPAIPPTDTGAMRSGSSSASALPSSSPSSPPPSVPPASSGWASGSYPLPQNPQAARPATGGSPAQPAAAQWEQSLPQTPGGSQSPAPAAPQSSLQLPPDPVAGIAESIANKVVLYTTDSEIPMPSAGGSTNASGNSAVPPPAPNNGNEEKMAG